MENNTDNDMVRVQVYKVVRDSGIPDYGITAVLIHPGDGPIFEIPRETYNRINLWMGHGMMAQKEIEMMYKEKVVGCEE